MSDNNNNSVVPNFSGRLTDKATTELTFIEVLFTIIIAWILVTLWQRVVDNLMFSTLNLDNRSTYQTFLIAVLWTVIFVVLSFTFNELVSGILIGGDDDSQFAGNIKGPVNPTQPDKIDNDNPIIFEENLERKNGIVEVNNNDSTNLNYKRYEYGNRNRNNRYRYNNVNLNSNKYRRNTRIHRFRREY